MNNQAHLKSWLYKLGNLGFLIAGERQWIKALQVSLSFCTGVCLLTATTTPHQGVAGRADSAAAQETVPSTTQVKGKREYTLTRLYTGVSGRDRYRRAINDMDWASEVGFRVTEQGKPAPWELIDFTVTDRKGTKWRCVSRCSIHEGDEAIQWFVLGPAFADSTREIRPDDGEWKLHSEFSQTGDFAPADLWTVRDIPMPRKRQSSDGKVIASTRLHETKVELQQLISRGEPFNDGTEILGRKTPAVMVVSTPKRERLHLSLVKATDNRGREVHGSLITRRSGSDVIIVGGPEDPNYRYYFSLDDVQRGVKSVNLTFALHESDFVDFTVKPTVLTK